MSNQILNILGNIADSAENDVSSAAKTVMNYVNQSKAMTKTNGALSKGPLGQAVQGYINSSTGPTTQMGAVDPNASPATQVGQAFSAPIDPTSDALNMGAMGIHSALPFLAGAIRDVKPTEILSKILPGVENTATADQGLSDIQKARVTKDNPTGANPIQNLDLSSKYGMSAPRHEADVQNTLDTKVAGNNPEEVYNNLEQTKNDLGKQIEQKAKANPSTVTADNPNGITYQSLGNDMMIRAANEGLDTNDPKVKAAIAKQINHISGKANGTIGVSGNTRPVFNEDLTPVDNGSATIKGKPATGTVQYRRAGGAKAGTEGPPGRLVQTTVKNGDVPINEAQPATPYNPGQMASSNQKNILANQPLTTTQLVKELREANESNAKILAKRGAGNPLTDEEQAKTLYRDTVRDHLTDLNPGASDALDSKKTGASSLITQQSHLYDATPSVADARSAYRKTNQTGANTNTGNSNFFQRHWKFLTGLGIAGAGTVGTGAYAGYLLKSQPQKFNLNGASISEPDITNIVDKNGQSISQGDVASYQQQYDNLQTQKQQYEQEANSYNPVTASKGNAALAKLTDQENALQNKYGSFGPTIAQYTKMQEGNKQLKNVQDILNSGSADPKWFTAIMPTLNNPLRSIIPGYSAFAAQVDTLKNYGIDPSTILGAATPQAANAAINQLIKSNIDNTNTYLHAQGFSVKQNSPSTQGANMSVSNPTSIPAPTSVPTLSAPMTSPTPNEFQQMLQEKAPGGGVAGGGGYTASSLLEKILASAHSSV